MRLNCQHSLDEKDKKVEWLCVMDSKKPQISERERRLQEALRENLRKRKAQARESKVKKMPTDESPEQ